MTFDFWPKMTTNQTGQICSHFLPYHSHYTCYNVVMINNFQSADYWKIDEMGKSMLLPTCVPFEYILIQVQNMTRERVMPIDFLSAFNQILWTA